jgi:hypothetical protein
VGISLTTDNIDSERGLWVGKLRAKERFWLLLGRKCELGMVIERGRRRSGLTLKTEI